MSRQRKFILLVVLALFISLLASGVLNRISVEELKHHSRSLSDFKNSQPILSGLLFFGVYFLFTALALPGAGVISLAGGALFGAGWGTLLVSLSSVCGATAACALSRYLFGEQVRKRFPDFAQTIERGIQREGSRYLLSLRLIPLFPFFLVNLVLGLTPMPLFRFAWVSCVGMLPASFLFVNAGTQLARIQTLSDVLTVQLIGSLTAIGLLPLLGQWIFKRLSHLFRTN